MTIRLNDLPKELQGTTTLQELLSQLGHGQSRGIAVALNDTVVRRAAWANLSLADGDRVLVIQATQGG